MSIDDADVADRLSVEERPVDEVMSMFNLPRNSIYQIKVRVDKMVAAIEKELGD